MTSPQDLPTRVSRNSNDIDELYKITKKTHDQVQTIAAVQHRHGQTLNRVEDTLAQHSVRLSGLTTSLDRVNGRLDRMEETQNEHSLKLDIHDRKLDSHGEKLDSHGEKLDQILGLLRQRE